MTFARKKNIKKASTESHFGYFPLVWMLYGRQINVDINQIPERAKIAVYNNEVSLFEELIVKDKWETMHQRNIKILASELFKIKNNLSNDIMV